MIESTKDGIFEPETLPECPAITVDELERMDVFTDQEEPVSATEWRITDDSLADWAVRKIAEERAELQRIQTLAEGEIERIKAKVAKAEKRYTNGTEFLTRKLAQFFETVPHKTTKTKHSYRLLSGTLTRKIGGVSMKQDDATLLEYLKKSGNADMIKVKEEPKWGDYKKRLEIVGEQIIDKETGEIVEGVAIIEKPDTFTVDV